MSPLQITLYLTSIKGVGLYNITLVKILVSAGVNLFFVFSNQNSLNRYNSVINQTPFSPMHILSIFPLNQK